MCKTCGREWPRDEDHYKRHGKGWRTSCLECTDDKPLYTPDFEEVKSPWGPIPGMLYIGEINSGIVDEINRIAEEAPDIPIAVAGNRSGDLVRESESLFEAFWFRPAEWTALFPHGNIWALGLVVGQTRISQGVKWIGPVPADEWATWAEHAQRCLF